MRRYKSSASWKSKIFEVPHPTHQECPVTTYGWPWLAPDHKTIADFRKGLKDQELIRGINSPENGPRDPEGLQPVRRALPPAQSLCRSQRGD